MAAESVPLWIRGLLSVSQHLGGGSFAMMLGGSFAGIVMLILALSAMRMLIGRSAGFSQRCDLALDEPHQEMMEP